MFKDFENLLSNFGYEPTYEKKAVEIWFVLKDGDGNELDRCFIRDNWGKLS